MKRLLLASLVFVGVAGAVYMHPMKEGLWAVHTETIRGDEMSRSDYAICRNAAYDAKVFERAMKGCKTVRGSVSGGVISTDYECATKGALTRKSETLSAGGDALRSKSRASRAGFEIIEFIEQNYVTACPAGVGPGDMLVADGPRTVKFRGR